MKLQSRRFTGQLLSTLLLASSGAFVALPAVADTFTPLSDPPTVEITNAPTTMQPNYPSSDASYSVDATIGTQGTVENLDTVTMCFYRMSGDNTCADAATDPKNEFKMVWTQSSNTFTVTGTNNYEDDGSAATGLSTDLSLSISFDFKISNAMDAGLDWEVKVFAVDDDGQNSDQTVDMNYEFTDVESLISVYYWGEVTTDRAGLDFGNVAANQSADVDGASLGAFVANDSSYIYLDATDFSDGNGSTLSIDTIGSPMLGEVTLSCEYGATEYSGSSPTYVGTTAYMPLASSLFSDGTGETPDSSQIHSCRLEYGGGATVAEVEYENTVTVAISNLP